MRLSTVIRKMRGWDVPLLGKAEDSKTYAGICSSLNQHLIHTEAPLSPFVIPTEVEGSAVRSTGI